MRKIIKYCLMSLFLVYLIPCPVNGQSQDSNYVEKKTQIDSTDKPYKFLLFMNPYIMEKRFFLGQDKYDTYEDKPSIITDEDNFYSGRKSIADLKAELNTYLQTRYNQLPDYDLGDFGRYLGYANAAATVILAIIHITKYGFK